VAARGSGRLSARGRGRSIVRGCRGVATGRGGRLSTRSSSRSIVRRGGGVTAVGRGCVTAVGRGRMTTRVRSCVAASGSRSVTTAAPRARMGAATGRMRRGRRVVTSASAAASTASVLLGVSNTWDDYYREQNSEQLNGSSMPMGQTHHCLLILQKLFFSASYLRISSIPETQIEHSAFLSVQSIRSRLALVLFRKPSPKGLKAMAASAK